MQKKCKEKTENKKSCRTRAVIAEKMRSCDYCGGELKPVEEFFKQNGEEEYKKMREEFKKLIGFEMPISNKFNCVKCGRVYDENLNLTKHSIRWLLN